MYNPERGYTPPEAAGFNSEMARRTKATKELGALSEAPEMRAAFTHLPPEQFANTVEQFQAALALHQKSFADLVALQANRNFSYFHKAKELVSDFCMSGPKGRQRIAGELINLLNEANANRN